MVNRSSRLSPVYYQKLVENEAKILQVVKHVVKDENVLIQPSKQGKTSSL